MKPSNPFLAPNYEAALEALTHGPMTSNQHGALIRPVDQLAEAARTLHGKVDTAKAEGAAEAYEDIKAQAEDLRKEGGIRASLLRLLTEECVSRAAAIRKGPEAKEGK